MFGYLTTLILKKLSSYKTTRKYQKFKFVRLCNHSKIQKKWICPGIQPKKSSTYSSFNVFSFCFYRILPFDLISDVFQRVGHMLSWGRSSHNESLHQWIRAHSNDFFSRTGEIMNGFLRNRKTQNFEIKNVWSAINCE